jgi:hypothetical protein
VIRTGDGVTPDFRRLVEALRPFLPDVVVVGGWAHQLFELHPLARQPDFVPLTTDDADIALPAKLRVRAIALGERLRRADFKEEMSGTDRPPVTKYRLGDGGFYAEFLLPKTGAGVRRSGERDATARVQGVVAQKLPHVEVLLLDPWTVELPPEDPHGHAVKVRIPNAVTYLAQKLLVLVDRQKEKQDGDVVYIHDTLTIFVESLSALRQLWGSLEARLTSKQVRSLEHRIESIFGSVDDRIRRAARMVRETERGAPPSAKQIQERCRGGLLKIFGA